jgi:hypothetical protein
MIKPTTTRRQSDNTLLVVVPGKWFLTKQLLIGHERTYRTRIIAGIDSLVIQSPHIDEESGRSPLVG